MASLSLGVALESLSSNPANSISECPQHTPGRALKDTGLEHQYRSIFVKSLSCHRMSTFWGELCTFRRSNYNG